MARKTRAWTKEQREKQAEIARARKPWLRSTGPKTEDGKDRIKMNNLKHGAFTRDMRELRRVLHKQRQFLTRVKKELLR